MKAGPRPDDPINAEVELIRLTARPACEPPSIISLERMEDQRYAITVTIGYERPIVRTDLDPAQVSELLADLGK